MCNSVSWRHSLSFLDIYLNELTKAKVPKCSRSCRMMNSVFLWGSMEAQSVCYFTGLKQQLLSSAHGQMHDCQEVWHSPWKASIQKDGKTKSKLRKKDLKALKYSTNRVRKGAHSNAVRPKPHDRNRSSDLCICWSSSVRQETQTKLKCC